MASQWPPSPRVEDEQSALKNEITHESEANDKNEAEEAPCRGTVDQHPIILDINHQGGLKHEYNSSTDNDGDSIRTHSSDDSYGPPTPPHTKAGKKHSYLPRSSPTSQTWSGKVTPPTTVKEPDEEVTPRGRPSMPRIQTDVEGDVQGMITGRRRAPSPYSYTKPDASRKADDSHRLSRNAFLSPDHVAPSQSSLAADKNRRPSARSGSKTRSRKDSDDSSGADRRHRHHSRRRSTRQQSPPNGPVESSTGDKSSSGHANFRSAKDSHPKHDSEQQSPSQSNVNDRHHKCWSKDSPYTSSADDSWSKGRSEFVSRSDKRSSRESPCTSSAEEGRVHRRDLLSTARTDGKRPHRSSDTRKERPQLDLSGHHYSYHGAPTEERHSGGKYGRHGHPTHDGRSYLEPSSLRSPQAMEEYLEKALKDNTARSSKTSHHKSPVASPRGSPPRTPPRTSHDNRSSKDYFSLGMSAPLQPAETARPRAPSHSGGDYSQVKPMASVLAGAAGGRTLPVLLRSSVSPTEIHANGHPSQQIGGRRSRNSSPVREEAEPHLRSGSDHDNNAPKHVRDEDRPVSQPLSRAGSTSHYYPPLVAPTDRHITRTTSYSGPPVEIPRVNQRAFSYSPTDASQHPRWPGSAKPTQQYFVPPLTPIQPDLHLIPRLPRSPSSSEKSPGFQQLAELPPCPRSRAEAGHYDWYTIVGMPEIDVCPSCMTVLGASQFRHMFVPSPSKVPDERILCDFSRPWIRLAWAQIIKQRRNSLEIIGQILHNYETTKACPGKGTDVRAWFRLPDPTTGSSVPNFDACSECVRSIEIVFPQLRGIFKRSGALVQERTCDLNTESRRFHTFMKLLDAAALQYDVERLREPNIQAFANFARKAARLRECPRDDMIMGQVWHFIPSLPEFTVCEECYHEVVWPVINQPVASSFNRTLQLVPGTTRHTGISCQLYSERMRKKFLEAVKYADFEFLRQVVLRRHGVERLLQEKHKLWMNDMAMGRDRTAELRANIEEWKKWE